MDITKESEEVGVDIDELGLVAPLENMACRAQRLVPIARVTHGDALHGLAQWLLIDLH